MLLKWHAAAILSYSKLLCNNTCLCLCSGSRALEPGDDKQRGLGWWMPAQKQFEHCFSLKHELSTAQRCEHNMSPASNRKRSELSICHILFQQIALFCLNGYNFQQQYWNLKKNPTRTTSGAARLDLDWNACPPVHEFLLLYPAPSSLEITSARTWGAEHNLKKSLNSSFCCSLNHLMSW